MNQTKDQSREQKVASFLGQVMDYRDDGERGTGAFGAEYWADAPWRLEPDQAEIPLTFIARDAVGNRLDSIEVFYYMQNDQENSVTKETRTNPRGKWELLQKFSGPGNISQQYWLPWHRIDCGCIFESIHQPLTFPLLSPLPPFHWGDS